MAKGFGRILYGGDYNPNQWPKEIWDQDMVYFRDAHINSETINVFSWAKIQPSEEEYYFDELDEIVDMLSKENYDIVLATSTGAMPAWMYKKYPEVGRVDYQGRRHRFGQRHNACPHSPIYQKYAKALVEQLVRRYGDNPKITCWHINNEYNGECYCENCEKAFDSIRLHVRLFSWLFRMGALAVLIPAVLLWEDKDIAKLFDGPGLMLVAFFAVAMIFHFICRTIHGKVKPLAIYEVDYTYEATRMVEGKPQVSGYFKPRAMISREGSIIEAREREKNIHRYVWRNFFQNIMGFVMLVLFVCASNITLADNAGKLEFNLELPQILQATLFLFLATRVLKHMTWSFEYDFDGLDEWIEDKRKFYKVACVFVSILGILSGVMLGFDGLSGILLVVIGALALIEFIIDCRLSSDDDDEEDELEEGEFTVHSSPYGMYGEHHYYGRAHFPKTPDTRYNESNCVYDDDWDD